MTLRRSLMIPIPQIFTAAENLSKAVDAHLAGDRETAGQLFAAANDPEVWSYTNIAWGAGSRTRYAFDVIADAPPYLIKSDRPSPRMPTRLTRKAVLERDGYHCRFCGMPVIADTTRKRLRVSYPDTIGWGKTNASQHAAFQCMWLQFDHILPNSRGGSSDIDNVVITCAPCNFGRMEATLAEARLINPLDHDIQPIWSGGHNWDGLDRP